MSQQLSQAGLEFSPSAANKPQRFSVLRIFLDVSVFVVVALSIASVFTLLRFERWLDPELNIRLHWWEDVLEQDEMRKFDRSHFVDKNEFPLPKDLSRTSRIDGGRNGNRLPDASLRINEVVRSPLPQGGSYSFLTAKGHVKINNAMPQKTAAYLSDKELPRDAWGNRWYLLMQYVEYDGGHYILENENVYSPGPNGRVEFGRGDDFLVLPFAGTVTQRYSKVLRWWILGFGLIVGFSYLLARLFSTASDSGHES